MKNLLIGGSDLYDWSKVKTWANSARDAGHNGDIVILAYRIKNQDEYLEEARKLDIDVYQIDYDQYGQPIKHHDKGRDTQSHQMRFFHMWQYLMENHDYKYVISTDIRDVYFQRNPFEFLNEMLPDIYTDPFEHFIPKLIASAEGMKYEDEPWGLDNMFRGFGPIVTEYAKPWPIFNVGVMAGPPTMMRDMFFKIYNMTVGRYIPSDQSAYNIFVNMTDKDNFFTATHDAGWVCQCGTALDPEKSHYIPKFQGPRPSIIDGRVYTSYGEEYYIVHQWDRVPELQYIGELY